MKRRAFTLVELLVVIAIIGLLSTVAVVALSSSRVNARNTKRKADLIQISKALELFYSDNGSYPSTGGIAAWRGACADYGAYPDTTDSAWIPNFSNYMAKLPHDVNTNKAVNLHAYCQANPGGACYLYTSNGTDYKLNASCLPEGTLASILADPLGDPLRGGASYTVYSVGASAW